MTLVPLAGGQVAGWSEPLRVEYGYRPYSAHIGIDSMRMPSQKKPLVLHVRTLELLTDLGQLALARLKG